MTRTIWVYANSDTATLAVATYLLDWAQANPGCALGGATGRSPINVWSNVWSELNGPRASEKSSFVDRHVLFLDEYFGAHPSYYHWAQRNLRVGKGGFGQHHIHTPRGCFFEFDRVVDSARLNELLAEYPEQWDAMTAVGEDEVPPEVRFNSSVEHPVLSKLQQSMDDYDNLVKQHNDRLQLLGIGVGGAIDNDSRAGGHIGFVEYGAASRDTKTMLVRMASSTLDANRADFNLVTSSDQADTTLQSTQFAVTQGISTILSAGELLLMAWGKSKTKAVQRMLHGQPSPYNPAAWVQEHSNVTIFLDEEAATDLNLDDLADQGWTTIDRRIGSSAS